MIVVGNCVVLKFFELIFYMLSFFVKMFNENFFEEYLMVVEGEVEISMVLLKENFDYIFFIGSIMVGKIVVEVVVKYLMFVMFELGGKSFIIVYEDVNIEEVVKCIVCGKFVNVG